MSMRRPSSTFFQAVTTSDAPRVPSGVRCCPMSCTRVASGERHSTAMIASTVPPTLPTGALREDSVLALVERSAVRRRRSASPRRLKKPGDGSGSLGAICIMAKAHDLPGPSIDFGNKRRERRPGMRHCVSVRPGCSLCRRLHPAICHEKHLRQQRNSPMREGGMLGRAGRYAPLPPSFPPFQSLPTKYSDNSAVCGRAGVVVCGAVASKVSCRGCIY